jgi:hypothetical protein
MYKCLHKLYNIEKLHKNQTNMSIKFVLQKYKLKTHE